MVEIFLNFLIVVGMILMSALTALARVQSPIEAMTVTILTLLAYTALNVGVMKMRQSKMQQDINELKELIKKKQIIEYYEETYIYRDFRMYSSNCDMCMLTWFCYHKRYNR